MEELIQKCRQFCDYILAEVIVPGNLKLVQKLAEANKGQAITREVAELLSVLVSFYAKENSHEMKRLKYFTEIDDESEKVEPKVMS